MITLPASSLGITIEPDRDRDLCNRRDWTAFGRAARNRVRDLGRGVFVAWRSRLAHGRLALFARLDEHARRIRADAATTLAGDGRAGGSRRDATVRCEHGVPFLGDADVLVNAHRARDPQHRLTRDGSPGGCQPSAALRQLTQSSGDPEGNFVQWDDPAALRASSAVAVHPVAPRHPRVTSLSLPVGTIARLRDLPKNAPWILRQVRRLAPRKKRTAPKAADLHERWTWRVGTRA